MTVDERTTSLQDHGSTLQLDLQLNPVWTSRHNILIIISKPQHHQTAPIHLRQTIRSSPCSETARFTQLSGARQGPYRFLQILFNGRQGWAISSRELLAVWSDLETPRSCFLLRSRIGIATDRCDRRSNFQCDRRQSQV